MSVTQSTGTWLSAMFPGLRAKRWRQSSGVFDKRAVTSVSTLHRGSELAREDVVRGLQIGGDAPLAATRLMPDALHIERNTQTAIQKLRAAAATLIAIRRSNRIIRLFSGTTASHTDPSMLTNVANVVQRLCALLYAGFSPIPVGKGRLQRRKNP